MSEKQDSAVSADATPVVDSSGVITSVTVVNGGSGYIAPRRYRPGSMVSATGYQFWMTVRATEDYDNMQKCHCTFGSSDSDAGVWLASDLTPYEPPAAEPRTEPVS